MTKTAKDLGIEVKKMSFEDSLKELEGIVKKLESGQQDLDLAIDEYSKGILLKEHCEKKLADAKLKVEKIMKGGDGSLSVKETKEE